MVHQMRSHLTTWTLWMAWVEIRFSSHQPLILLNYHHISTAKSQILRLCRPKMQSIVLLLSLTRGMESKMHFTCISIHSIKVQQRWATKLGIILVIGKHGFLVISRSRAVRSYEGNTTWSDSKMGYLKQSGIPNTSMARHIPMKRHWR